MKALSLMFALGILVSMSLAVGCETAPGTVQERDALETEARATLDRFMQRDPGLEQAINAAHAHAVFPTVTKGGAGIGGAHGQGVVFSNGQFVGWTDLTQGTVGPQLGGQTYSQLILFEDEAAFERFSRGDMTFAAQASAVAADAGASAAADYEDGVQVYTMTTGGLMFEASIGGQSFNFIPAQDN